MKRLLIHDAREGTLVLRGPGHHHLVHVLRSTAGEQVEVFNGAGLRFDATLNQVGAEEAELTLGPARAGAAVRHVAVMQGLPKGDKFELVLQKCTELGASAFWPVATERSIVKIANFSPGKTQRWQTIVDEAARQCGRSDVPAVHAPQKLAEALASLPQDAQVLVLDEEERAIRLSTAIDALAPGAPVVLLIGPEGGLSREELHGVKATRVSLGANILRTETAALAALTVIRHREGLLG